jgi:hypothetical protein
MADGRRREGEGTLGIAVERVTDVALGQSVIG